MDVRRCSHAERRRLDQVSKGAGCARLLRLGLVHLRAKRQLWNASSGILCGLWRSATLEKEASGM